MILTANELGTLPAPPDGWQYGVVRGDGRIWACGLGERGARMQRMRLRYSDVTGPCLLPYREDPYDTGR